MKKSIVAAIAAVLTIFMMTGAVFGSSSAASGSASAADASAAVTQVPDITIILEGNVTKFKNVPVSVKGNTLLPLREYLVNLGVPNNDSNIKYDAKEKSVYIKYKQTEVMLYIGKTTAYVNKEPVTLNTAPILHNSLTYIPVRSIAELFGKKVVWDGETRSIMICDAEKYDRIHEILTRSNEAGSKIKKYNLKMEVKAVSETDAIKTEFGIKSISSVDKGNRKMYVDMVIKLFGFEFKTASYYADKTVYTLNPMDNNWYKKVYTDVEYGKLFDEKSADSIADESLCAGLNIMDSENEDEIVLRGDVYLKELFKSALAEQNGSMAADTEELKVSDDFGMTIVIDKNTFMLKKVSMDVSAEQKADNTTVKTDVSVSMEYSDFDGDFEVVVPQYIIKNAIEDVSESSF